ncbi:Rho termination factor N-terminal domain-containing protein [Modestobacter sp. VKM Ac-2986]|uniref:Rho termination factor N-terminal domain-containing protein n=1 Tax=Modestobacter sp. VKM Ac-2986 TaxID=3004140 RepID=UPI0022AADAD8|nr:transcription termination factor Rho [Modestobacter sp. VKM Ac-2986]MCZ2828032.1 Rho termination factor N-terminal domain-containing protein [Modestobacter sp. VKM Ac-2986]
MATDEKPLEDMKVDELRDVAREEGVRAPSSKNKGELVEAIGEQGGGTPAEDTGSEDTGSEEGDLGAGPDGGEVRTGDKDSKSLKYSQNITSTDEDPERQGRSLVTTHHEVIREWAEARGGSPATVPNSEYDGRPGRLRIRFQDSTGQLVDISWEDWFRTFDERRLNFIYQEDHTDGRPSTFFQLENPDTDGQGA